MPRPDLIITHPPYGGPASRMDQELSRELDEIQSKAEARTQKLQHREAVFNAEELKRCITDREQPFARPDTTAMFVGVDLGEKRDRTAVAILEGRGHGLGMDFVLKEMLSYEPPRHIEEVELAISLMMEGLAHLIDPVRVEVMVDVTGGHSRTVRELNSWRDRHWAYPRRLRVNEIRYNSATFHAGEEARLHKAGEWSLPKKELVRVLQLAVKSERLRIPALLRELPALWDELLNFTEGESAPLFSGPSDDRLDALMLALWKAHNTSVRQEYIRDWGFRDRKV